ncbi:MAG: argininosuccinate synthase [Rubricoccaceae bacterium]
MPDPSSSPPRPGGAASAPLALAFSGGLDTSFCVPFLRETIGAEVHTVTVNTGGFSADELVAVEARAHALGAASHTTVDARERLFERVLQYLIKGNVLRGGVYPLCVGPERVVQAEALVDEATRLGARTIAHGSTGAGNDQVRFDTALRLLAERHIGAVEILAPIREHGLTREATTAYLRERNVPVEARTTAYSINRGLWGTTIGGRETHTPDGVLPEEAWPDTVSPALAPDTPLRLRIGFDAGIPTSLDGEALAPVALIEALNETGARHGVGRGVHVGDTILGIKGRVAFEAPAALTLIAAHRELEKLVLTKWQAVQKAALGDFYGMLVHEGQFFDPVLRDVEAFLDSSQARVTGEVTLELFKGAFRVLGAASPYSLFDAGVARYGETNALWNGRDAEGFARIHGVPAFLAARAAAAGAVSPARDAA